MLLSAWSASNEEVVALPPPADAPLLLPEPLSTPDAAFDGLNEARSKGTQTMTSWQVGQQPQEALGKPCMAYCCSHPKRAMQLQNIKWLLFALSFVAAHAKLA